MKNKLGYEQFPFDRKRRLMEDGGKIAKSNHTIHGIYEIDITGLRSKIRKYNNCNRQHISFLSFFLYILSSCLSSDKSLYSYKDWRNNQCIFEDLDLNLLFEMVENGEKVIRPHIIRKLNKLSSIEIFNSIMDFKNNGFDRIDSQGLDLFLRLPGFIRRAILRLIMMNPKAINKYMGTVLVSSVSMFGKGIGWAFPVPSHTLQVTLGGIGKLPRVHKDEIKVREILCLTISFDHDILDGANVARFATKLKKMLETASEKNHNISII